MFTYCLQLLKRILPLSISKQEFVLLKALLLTNVGKFKIIKFLLFNLFK